MSDFTPSLLPVRLAPFADAPRCWIALSGGLDSSVLLSSAAEVRERIPGELWAVHVDHGLQPQSSDWADRCASQCAALALPIRIERLKVGPSPGESLEAWARAARYAVLGRLVGPGEILLTAHHRDDQAETLLLALLRGAGVQGLAAMPFSAPLGAGHLIRPLLDCTRQSLLEHARRRGLDWIEDPSNALTALDRNYLRHQVMPLLRARWPATSETLSRSARHCAEAADLVNQMAARTLVETQGTRPGSLSIPGIQRLDRALRKATLRLWLKEGGFTPPNTRHLDRILDELLPARADANPLVGWRGCEIRRYREDLFALPPLPEAPSPSLEIEWSVGEKDSTLALSQSLGRLQWRPHGAQTGWNDGGVGDIALKVRFNQTGLSCKVSATGRRRPLKRLFQEAGVPVWLRPYVPMLYQGETLIAIVGIGVCRDGEVAMGLVGDLLWRGHPWTRHAPFVAQEIRLQPLDDGKA